MDEKIVTSLPVPVVDDAQVHDTRSSSDVPSANINQTLTTTYNNGDVANMYLIIANISKRQNIRSLVQTAAAFGCAGIFVVGQKNFRFEPPQQLQPSPAQNGGDATTSPTSRTPPSQESDDIFDVDDDYKDDSNHDGDSTVTPTRKNEDNNDDRSRGKSDLPNTVYALISAGILPIRRFEKWIDCVQHIQRENILLIGVEIHKDAKSIEELIREHFGPGIDTDGVAIRRPVRDVAFIMGNEGTGLLDKHIQSCDAFCRIPQYGNGTASLNVYVAASIILYHFHMYRRQQLLQLQPPVEETEPTIYPASV